MLDSQGNEVPAWVEKKPFIISANLRCDYCGDNFQAERKSSRRLLGGIETEDEVLKNIQTGAQQEHYKCWIKSNRKTTIVVKNFAVKNIK